MTSSEVWYNVTEKDIKELNKVDKVFLQKLMQVPKSVPGESLYLEMGILPIKSILITRRMRYLKYLLQRNPNSMLSKFFHTQWKKESPGDWTQQIKKDMNNLNIKCTLSELKEMSDEEYKQLIDNKVEAFTFESLMKKKETHSKMSKVSYKELKIQKYLLDKDIPTATARLVFKYRTHMLSFHKNLKGMSKDEVCPLCNSHNDDQDEMENCPVLKEKFPQIGICKTIYEEDVSTEAVDVLTRAIDYKKQEETQSSVSDDFPAGNSVNEDFPAKSS